MQSPADKRGLPRVEADIETGDDGVPRCRAVRVTSVAGGRDVQSADLRRLMIEQLIEAAVVTTGRTDTGEGLSGWGGTDALHKRMEATAAAAREARRLSRRRITDDVLRKVAEVYQANPGAPTKAVAEAFRIERRTARLYVERARKAALLPQLGSTP